MTLPNKLYNPDWREKHDEANRRHYQTHKYEYMMRAKLRKETIRQAAPKWLTRDHWIRMESMYEQARQLTKDTGEYYVVDHVWPLKGARSCGLHVPWNLQILHSCLNDAKGNKEPEQ